MTKSWMLFLKVILQSPLNKKTAYKAVFLFQVLSPANFHNGTPKIKNFVNMSLVQLTLIPYTPLKTKTLKLTGKYFRPLGLRPQTGG